MTDQVETENTEVVTVDIIRGRMPLAMVYAIRFLETGNDSELATKYRTTPGKVNDIKKNRNFAYVTADTRFTQEQVDQAKDRAAQLEGNSEGIVETLSSMDIATTEEAAAFDAQRKTDRKPRGGAKASSADDASAEGESAEVAEDDVTEEELDDLLG